jgi:hypothetical protein
METVEKKGEYAKIPYIINPKSRALIWRQSAGLLKGRVKNIKRKLADLRKEWGRS